MENRTIKFRAWHTINRVMMPFENLVVALKNINVGNHMIILQDTGKTDSNNEPIYEGDICLVFGKHTAEVRWSDQWSGWIFYCPSLEEEIRDLPFFDGDKKSNTEGCVILGNIFENPELLTTQKAG